MIPAKTCYSHLGGKLGLLLMEAFITNGWIEKSKPGSKDYVLTSQGEKGLTRLGVDLSQIKKENQ